MGNDRILAIDGISHSPKGGHAMTHLSLFSGIGGMDLAAEWAGFRTVGQCEWADYPTKVLEKHWPDVPRWRDIHELSADDFRKKTGLERPTIISGGFPCQPHSLAGKRKASGDERDLWPEYRRVICEIKPRWVVAENVRGILTSEDGRFFRGILRDLAELGFDVGWCSYRAADVGAVHARERVAIIAHAYSERWDCMDENSALKCGRQFEESTEYTEEWARLDAETLDILRAGERSLYIKGGINRRNDDGISEGMDRLKCLGNAVVPQQFYPVFRAIAEAEIEREEDNDGPGKRV